VSLAERGLSVLGVEVDQRMAEFARSHGIEVQVAAFDPIYRTNAPQVAQVWRPSGCVQWFGGVDRGSESVFVKGSGR
jgi:hypothetical protein